MTALYETLGAGVVLSWVLFQGLIWVLRPKRALIVALTLGILPFAVIPQVSVPAMIQAVFAPFGVLLPVLAARSLAASLGHRVTRFASLDLIVVLGLYVTYLCAALGVFAWDPYPLGYSSAGAGAVAVAIALYGAWRGHVSVAVGAVLGQGLWLLGAGSSNYFDHVSHALLVPVIVVVLLRRLGRLLRKPVT